MANQYMRYEFVAAALCASQVPREKGTVLIDEFGVFWGPNREGGHSPMSNLTLTELASPVTITGSGLVRGAASEYSGFHVRAAVGFPQTVTVYDSLTLSGVPVQTVTVTGLGYYPWSGNKVRPQSVGVYAGVSGGTSRSLEFI